MTAGARRWRRALSRALEPPRSDDEANERLLYREIAWYGIVNGVGATFTSVFAVRLGASNQLLGLLVSAPALVAIALQLPAARLVERRASLRRVIVTSFLLNRLGYLAIALLLLVEVCPREGRPTYIGIYNMMVNAASFLGPLLGTLVADWLSIRAGLLIAAALRLATVGALLIWVRSERRPALNLRLRTL